MSYSRNGYYVTGAIKWHFTLNGTVAYLRSDAKPVLLELLDLQPSQYLLGSRLPSGKDPCQMSLFLLKYSLIPIASKQVSLAGF